MINCRSTPGCFARKFLEHGGQAVQHDDVGRADSQEPAQRAPLDLPLERADFVQHAPGALEDRLPRRGRADAPSAAVEEARSQVTFQRCDLHRHGRLTHPERARGGGEAAQPRRRLETAQR